MRGVIVVLLSWALAACAHVPPPIIGELEARIAELRRLIEPQVQPILVTGYAYEVRLYGDTFRQVFEKVSGLPPSQRLVTLASVNAFGYLERQEFGCGPLPNGHWFVEIWPGRGVTGQLQVTSLQAAWQPSGTLMMWVDYDFRVDVPLHGHVVPCVGGGFGTYILTHGRATGTVTGLAQVTDVGSGRIQYKIQVSGLGKMPVQVCGDLENIGSFCRDVEFSLGDTSLGRGDFEVAFTNSGKVEFGDQIRKGYELSLQGKRFVVDRDGIMSSGDITIVWH